MSLAALALLPALAWAAPKTGKPEVKRSTQTSAVDYSLPLYKASTAAITVPLVLERFTAFDENLKSLSCEFAQVVDWRQSGVAQIVEGRLEYRKPQLLHIDQRSPEGQAMVSDGTWLWIHRFSTDQVIQTKLEDWKRSEPLAQGLLDFGNYAEMLQRYDVTISTVSAPDAKGHRRVELTLKPKDKKSAEDFALKLKLSTRDFFPEETELRAGQVAVRSSFRRVRYNPPIGDERFKFTPPPGADVFQNFKPPKPE